MNLTHLHSDHSPELAEVISVASDHFKKFGYKSVTMDDIARLMGKSKKTLYQLVSTKKELVELAIRADTENDDLAIVEISNSAENAIEAMMGITQHFVRNLIATSPAAIYDLQKYYRSCWELFDTQVSQSQYAHILENIERGQREGLYRTSIENQLIARFFIASAQTLRQLEVLEENLYDWKTVLNQFILYHLHAVVTEQGKALLDSHLEQISNSNE